MSLTGDEAEVAVGRGSSGGRRPPLSIAGHEVSAGHKAQFEIPIATLMSGTPVALPVLVLHGASDGPTMWMNAAIHGDEICGVEIIRRVLTRLDPTTMAGTVIAVPITNVHGFNTGDRYLPDRRDLNRSFPGSAKGSLASRVAHLMMEEVVRRCSVGIDLHTGSDHRINLPQIRADLDDDTTRDLAAAFGAPLSMHAKTRDGSLRHAATEAGATVLLFEGGEAERFDERAISMGAAGVLRVMGQLGITQSAEEALSETRWSRSSRWIRAPRSGIVHLDIGLGEKVEIGEPLASIFDPFGKRLGQVRSRDDGVVIGHTLHPLVNRGDAVAHVATLERLQVVDDE